MPSEEQVIHKVETEAAWYATQVGRAVSIRNQKTDDEIVRFDPPPSWGPGWSWNVCVGGIYFTRRTLTDSMRYE